MAKTVEEIREESHASGFGLWFKATGIDDIYKAFVGMELAKGLDSKSIGQR